MLRFVSLITMWTVVYAVPSVYPAFNTRSHYIVRPAVNSHSYAAATYSHFYVTAPLLTTYATPRVHSHTAHSAVRSFDSSAFHNYAATVPSAKNAASPVGHRYTSTPIGKSLKFPENIQTYPPTSYQPTPLVKSMVSPA